MPTILQSIEQCNIAALQEWIRQGADPNKPCSNDQLPLQIAIRQLFEKPELNSEQALQIIELLLLNGADPNQISIDKKNLLHYLSDKSGPGLGRSIPGLVKTSSYKEIYKDLVPRVVKMLFIASKFKISVDARNRYDETPFLVALQRRNFLLADFFLAQGASPVIAKKTTTVLHELIDAQEYAYIEKLLKLGIDIQETNQSGYGAIDMAHNSQAVLFLLRHGAVPRKSTLLDFFNLAQKENNAELMAYLFSQGLASFVDPQGMTALHHTRNYELFAKLVEVAPSGFLNESLAFYFVKQLSSNEELLLKYLGLLQQRGVNLCATDRENNTLLYDAARYANTAIIPFLLGEGVAVNVYSSRGETVLHLVAASYPHLLALLLTHGANTSLPDKEGLTALERIRHVNGSPLSEIDEALLLKLLEAHPIGKAIRNADTLVLIAVKHNYVKLLQALHARRVPFSPSKTNELDPYYLAIRENQFTLLPWLLGLLEGRSDYRWLLNHYLDMAMEHASYEMIPLLISAGAAIDRQIGKHNMLWHLFVNSLGVAKKSSTDPIQIFDFLLTNELNINALDSEETPLGKLIRCYGTAENSWGWIKIFMDNGADISRLPKELRYSVGLEAIKRADFDILQLVLKYRSFEKQPYIYNDEEYSRAIQQYNEDQQHIRAQFASDAIKNADTQLLTQLVRLGLNLNTPQGNHNNTLDLGVGFRYFLDEALYYSSYDPKVVQQSLAIFLIKQGCILHHPTSEHLHDSSNSNRLSNRSLLHQAAAYGWDNILKLLLQPEYGFPIDLQAKTHSGFATPLALAIGYGQFSTTKILLEAGANPLFIYGDGKNLLHMACHFGNYEIASTLINLNKIDINAIHSNIGENNDNTAAHLAASSPNSDAPKVLKLLLEKGARVDVELLDHMIRTNKPIEMMKDVLVQLLSSIPAHRLSESRLLHSAIYANNFSICELLLDACPSLMEMRDGQGHTPLHLATELGKENIFRLLMRKGANKNAQDHDGHDVATHLLFHSNYALLAEISGALPQRESKESKIEASDPGVFKTISLVEFGRLRAALVEGKEFMAGTSNVLFSLSQYCFNLLCLFETAANTCSYIEKHAKKWGNQPIHDLCLFQLPVTPNWHRKKWAHLFWEHGVAVAPFLHLAPRIEEMLGRAPDTLAEVEQAAKNIHYAREEANPTLAKLFIQYKVTERGFNHVLDHYKPKKNDRLPSIIIEGKTIGYPDFYLKKLSSDDPRGFILGALTACCQHVGGAGEACAMHGMNSPYGGFYAVFKRSPSKEAEKIRILYEKAQGSATLAEFLEKLRDKDQKNKGQTNKYRLIYQQIQTELNRASKKPVTEAAVMRALSTQLEKKWQTLAEGKIIAQCWAWISQQDALVLDSWERAQKEYDPVCEPFLVALSACAIEKHGFKRVLVGTSGQTPADLSFSKAIEVETPKDYYDYRDSRAQYLIATADKTATLISSSRALTLSGRLSSPTDEYMGREDYTSTQLDQCLAEIFKNRSEIQALPAIDLTTCDIAAVSNALKMALHFEELRFGTRQRKIVIQPMLSGEKFWTAWVLDATKRYTVACCPTYLDFAAKNIPDQVHNILHVARLDGRILIRTIPHIYNSESSWSGFWLVETLRHFANTLLLSIPVKDILAKKQAHKRLYVKTVTRTLENVGLFSSINMHAQTLVKAYCGLEDVDELEEATISQTVAINSVDPLPNSSPAPSESKEEKVVREREESCPIPAIASSSTVALLVGARAKMASDDKAAIGSHAVDNNDPPAKRV